jgi:hypothetical protein
MDVHLEHEFFFNPDGAGKVKLRWSGPADDADPRALVADEVRKAQGVEAWSDVSCAPEDGRLVFQGTAYFLNVAGLRFHCRGLHVSSTDLETAPGDKGGLIVKGRVEAKQEAPIVEPEKLAAEIAATREKMEMGRAFIEGLFGHLKTTVVVRLPGKIGKIKNAKKLDERSATATMSGKDLLAVFDRLLKDDDLMAEMLRRGGGPEAVASLLGDLGPLELETQGKLAPLFDFESEVAAAKAAFEALRESFGGPKRAAPAAGTRVVAAKLVHGADSDNELHPFGQNFNSYACVVAADLPEPALKADEGVLEAFILGDGTDATPSDEWDRRIHFPKLTKDGRTLFCEVSVKLPELPPDSIREIRGAVRVQVATREEEVELGFPALKAGAQGKAFDAVLERCETEEDGRLRIELRLALAMERVRTVELVDKKGQAVELNRSGYSSSGDECTLTLDGEVPLKPGAKLRARVLADLKELEVPFQAGPVDLLGRPR